MTPQRILIIQTAFIGDVILATALIEKLREFYPEADIDMMVRKGNESLLSGHPKLNEVIIWDKKAGKYSNLFRLLKRIRSSKYDVVVNVQRFGASGFLTTFSGARQRIGFAKNPFSIFFSKRVPHYISHNGEDYRHEVERNQLLIANMTDELAAKPKLYPSTEARERVKILVGAKKYYCLAPASVWFTKQFPEEKWVELIQALPTDRHIFLTGAPGDKELCERIAIDAGRSELKVMAGQLSLLESAVLMEGAEMNFVNDSAPLHLCSAMNAPVTAIFCSTIPEFGFGPLSNRSKVVQTREELDCRPCGLHGFKACPKSHFQCGKSIQISDLLP